MCPRLIGRFNVPVSSRLASHPHWTDSTNTAQEKTREGIQQINSILTQFGVSSRPRRPALGKLPWRWDGRQVAPGKHIAEKAQQLRVDQPVRSQNLPAIQLVFAAGKVRHHPTSLFHQQNPSRRIPRIQIELPKCIHAASGNVSQIQSCRASPPHPMRTQRELLVKVDRSEEHTSE